MTPQQVQLYITKCAEKGIPNRITLNVLLKEAGIKELPNYLEKRSAWYTDIFTKGIPWLANKGNNVVKYLTSKPVVGTTERVFSPAKTVAVALTPSAVVAGNEALGAAGGMASSVLKSLTPKDGIKITVGGNTPAPTPAAKTDPVKPFEFEPYGTIGAASGGLLGFGVGPSIFGTADPITARLLGAASGSIGGAIAGNIVKKLINNNA